MSSRNSSLKTVSECIVCTEPSTKIAHCPFCDYSSCRSCAQTYVLDETTPKCMNCRKEWSREIQNRELTQTFVNGRLKKHMEDVLFDSQRALMPETLEEYEREYKVSQLRKVYRRVRNEFLKYLHSVCYYDIRIQIKLLRDEVITNTRHVEGLDSEEYEETTRKLNEKQLRIREIEASQKYIELNAQYQNARNAYRTAGDHAQQLLAKKETKSEPRFIRACPSDGCRGFLDVQWKCGLCDLWTCSDCITIKGTTKDCLHVCNPDDVASAKLLAQDTKPCPKCASGIFKIDGCDQMWCTMCKTAFSWRTGEIETRVIHNPHYFEYQRQTRRQMARNMGDILCGRELDTHTVEYMRDIMTSKNIEEPLMMRIHDYMRATIHLQRVVLPNYRPDRVVDFRMLRLKYIATEITEEEFRSRLIRDMKKHDKNIEIGQVLQMLSFTLHELIFRFFKEIEPLTASQIYTSLDTLDEIDRLYEYANQCMLRISKVYGAEPIGVRVMDPRTLNEPVHYGTGIYSVNTQKTIL